MVCLVFLKSLKNLSQNHEITSEKNARNRIESSDEIFVIKKSISG